MLRTSRRGFVLAAVAGAIAGPIVVRADDSATPSPSPASALNPELPHGGLQADGTWAFTDDLGVTVTADAVPTKVIAHIGIASALYDFGFEVIGYYNPATDEDGNPLPIAGDLPLDRITHLGDYAEVDIELLLSLGADLFIGQNYDVVTGGMWPFPDDVLALINATTPVVSLAYGDGADVRRNIETIENLAAALGADVNTPAITDARTAFDTASDELQAALAEKPDLTALFLSGSSTGFWVDSAGQASTRYFASLGMEILPAADAEVSWEVFLDWEADLLFVDDRAPTWWSPEQLMAEIPVWEAHPAVIAGQVAPWRAQFISSYKGFTPVLTEVAGWVRQADDGIV